MLGFATLFSILIIISCIAIVQLDKAGHRCCAACCFYGNLAWLALMINCIGLCITILNA